MIMPLYDCSLDSCPHICVAISQKLYAQISSALNVIHECDLNHIDVKSANICIRENGDFVLIDLGGVVLLL